MDKNKTVDNAVQHHQDNIKPSRSTGNLRMNNDLPADHSTSSDEDDLGLYEERDSDARGTIGVSIGRLQSRLASPQTPAIEKVAALEKDGGFFDANPDGAKSPPETEVLLEDDGEDVDQDISSKPIDPAPIIRLPSSDGTETPEADQPKGSRSILRDAFSFGRRRATSDTTVKDAPRPRSFIMSGITSMGKLSPFSKSRETVSSSDTSQLNNQEPHDKPTNSHSNSKSNIAPQNHAEEPDTAISGLPSSHELRAIRSRPSTLRRTTSDNSLSIQRTLSVVSSLGDDSRFSDIHEQVNSRFKAVKDSFQDSHLKFPSISSLTPDFFRDRSNSGSSKSGIQSRSGDKPIDPMTRQPYHSAKLALQDVSIKQTALTHPHLTKAMNRLEGDLVILGGYRGSILRSAEPPHRQLWVPIKVGLNLRKVDLEVGLQEEDDERATETIIPGGMLTHIGPVDISRRLFKRLRSCENAKSEKLRVHDYGYDWRLHPLHLSKKLISFLESLPCNQPGVPLKDRGATVIAHSLGGLITRHAVNQRPDLFRGVVYAGVPKTCVNILGPLRNGDDVLMSSRVLTAQVNFTIRTSFALLPLNGRCFFDKNTKEEYRVDFFDPNTWIDCRLSPCVARALPAQTTASKPSGITGYVSSVAQALPSFPIPGRRATISKAKPPVGAATIGGIAEPDMQDSGPRHTDSMPKPPETRRSSDDSLANTEEAVAPSVRTAVTIPHEDAIAYLTRTLTSVKRFKQELAFNSAHDAANAYPPIAVIYGKSTPTVFGARVDGREGIKHADAYDDLAFASGDGVVLARAAMVPEGYKPARGGIVSSQRGHVTLLGDLEAVGRCLNAVMAERRKGVGCGNKDN